MRPLDSVLLVDFFYNILLIFQMTVIYFQTPIRMFDFQNSLHAMLSWFLDVRSKLIDGEGEHRAPAIASHIASSYRILNLPKGDLPTIQKKGTPFWYSCIT